LIEIMIDRLDVTDALKTLGSALSPDKACRG
jgi:hypothetical protein